MIDSVLNMGSLYMFTEKHHSTIIKKIMKNFYIQCWSFL